MASATILTAFREITDLTVTQYADLDVTDKAEPYALSMYNHIMDDTETITAHTTGDEAIDRVIAFFCGAYVFEEKFKKRVRDGVYEYEMFYQDGMRILNMIAPWKIAFDPNSRRYYPRHKNRGQSVTTATAAEYA